MSQTVKPSINPDHLRCCDRGIEHHADGWEFCSCERGRAARTEAEDNATEAAISRVEEDRLYRGEL